MAYTDWRTLVTDVTRHVNKTITESSVNNTLKVENDDLAGRKTIWKWDHHSWIHVMYLDSGMSMEQRTEVLRKLQSQSPTAYYKMSTTKPKTPPTPAAAAAAAKDKEDRTWRLSNLIQAIKDNW